MLAFLGFLNGLAAWSFRNWQTFHDVLPIVDSTYLHLWMGNNPRATGGPTNAVPPSLSALEYTGPIVIDADTRLVARAYNPRHNNLTGKSNPPISSHWSGPRKAVYNLPKPNHR